MWSTMKRGSIGLLLIAGTFVLADGVTRGQDESPAAPKKGDTLVIQLFDGESLSGWLGDETSWSVDDGAIVGRRGDGVAGPSFLMTEGQYQDFRLKLEFKADDPQTGSAVLLTGGSHRDDGVSTGLMLLIGGRYRIEGPGTDEAWPDVSESARTAERPGAWNRLEILVVGNRVRAGLNGVLILDWQATVSRNQSESPVGLRLPEVPVPHEIRFRKLLLETWPTDRLTTVDDDIVPADVGPRPLYIDPATPDLWSSFPEVVIPDELLAPIRHPEFGLKTWGIRGEEAGSFYGILKKVSEIKAETLRTAADEFRTQRHKVASNGKYQRKPLTEFPSFVDQYNNPDLYHGKLVTLHGHIRKLIGVTADENPYGMGDYWEAWLYDADGQSHPAIIVAPERDPRLPTGTELSEDHVSATGYFFKNFGYEAQDGMRFAPLFICRRIEYSPPRTAGMFEMGLGTKLKLVIAAVLTIMVLRFALKLWKHSKREDQDRRAVRNVVESADGDPVFDNITDNGGMLFPGNPETAADAAGDDNASGGTDTADGAGNDQAPR